MSQQSIGLPAALQPWAAALDHLDGELAIALGPAIRQLDQLLNRVGAAAAEQGRFDGYGGISRRGDVRRLVMSEWALADEVPLEFLRRAAEAELLYLAANTVDDRSTGRVAVLVDAGPDQLGAGRLVQLAVLIVLARRAARRGSDLLVGVLGQRPGEWLPGDRRGQLAAWLRARTATGPEPTDVDGWLAELDAADEAWILAGERLAGGLPVRRHVLVARECAWNEGGASAVEVRLDGDRLELALPRSGAAIRALRGGMLRQSGPPAARTKPGGLRWPAFTDASRILLGRGTEPEEIITAHLPEAGPARTVERHRFAGPVLTAARIGRRIVALTLVDGALQVAVHGRPLGRVTKARLPLDRLQLRSADVFHRADGPLTPLVFDGGELLFAVGDAWWRAFGDHLRADPGVRAVVPTDVADRPRVVTEMSGGLYERGRQLAAGTAPFVLGPARAFAQAATDGRWTIMPGDTEVPVDADERVLGLTAWAGTPGLVTVSPNGAVRIRRARATVGLGPSLEGRVAVHPTRPFLAIQRPNGAVDLHELDRGASREVLEPPP